MGEVPREPLSALEITGKPQSITLKVNGHMLPCTTAALFLDAGTLPMLRISLPVVDDTVVVLDGTVVEFAEETRAALVSMGWSPPADPGAGFLP